MAYYATRLFRLSPMPIRSLILTVRNWSRRQASSAGGVHRLDRELVTMEGWSRQRLEDYQLERLQQLLRLAGARVPHYRDLLRARGIRAEDLCSLVDLQRLPLLEKRAIREAPDRFRARPRPSAFLFQAVTTGTTGTPLRLYRDLRSISWEEARLRRWRRRAGVHPGDRRVIIRGDNFVPTSERTLRPWLHDRLGNVLLVSSYHLSDDLLPGITRKLQEFAPDAVEGYPYPLTQLARHLLGAGIRLPIKAVLTSSEQVYPHQRTLLEKGFGAEVFDQYGMAERVALAAECSHHRLHLDMECAITEVVQPDGRQCAPGQVGEIVGTSLTNLAMPLVRYRTGDVGSLGVGPCQCGLDRPYVLELQGRDDDFVTSENGSRFSATLVAYPFDLVEGVEEAQIVHPEPGRLVIRLVPSPGHPDPQLRAAKSNIKADLDKRLGGGFRMEFAIVDKIAKGAHGKYRFVVAAPAGPSSRPIEPR